MLRAVLKNKTKCKLYEKYSLCREKSFVSNSCKFLRSREGTGALLTVQTQIICIKWFYKCLKHSNKPQIIYICMSKIAQKREERNKNERFHLWRDWEQNEKPNSVQFNSKCEQQVFCHKRQSLSLFKFPHILISFAFRHVFLNWSKPIFPCIRCTLLLYFSSWHTFDWLRWIDRSFF